MSTSLIILMAAMVPAYVWLWRNTPSPASYISDGDVDRDRRFAEIEPLGPDEILDVIPGAPPRPSP